jgi:hypothetical protein
MEVKKRRVYCGIDEVQARRDKYILKKGLETRTALKGVSGPKHTKNESYLRADKVVGDGHEDAGAVRYTKPVGCKRVEYMSASLSIESPELDCLLDS